ncbi:MAG: hypothetical protein RQ966_12080 [Acetobacteraceae bacterium]|nr:hypothetical protein [Acetobacteraceae bacterium]
MNDKTQPSTRKDGFGTEGIGEAGDGSMGQAGSSGGGTGASTTGGRRNGATPAEGAFGDDAAKGRNVPANKQGIDNGNGAQD